MFADGLCCAVCCCGCIICSGGKQPAQRREGPSRENGMADRLDIMFANAAVVGRRQTDNSGAAKHLSIKFVCSLPLLVHLPVVHSRICPEIWGTIFQPSVTVWLCVYARQAGKPTNCSSTGCRRSYPGQGQADKQTVWPCSVVHFNLLSPLIPPTNTTTTRCAKNLKMLEAGVPSGSKIFFGAGELGNTHFTATIGPKMYK